MEKLNLNFSGGANVLKSICWIMSYISWLMLVITGWISIKWLDDEIYEIIWTISAPRKRNGVDPLEFEYYPLQMHAALIYVVFILALLIILGGCIVYFVKTICKKDDQVINGMMGEYSKYHFFPLLCVSALFIIGECVDQDTENEDHGKSMIIAGFIFTILGLASMIFVYIMTDLNTTDWWVLLLLKKGTYSCLIVLMWYYFCYNIYYVHEQDKPDDTKLWDWRKGCGIAFSIIFGIGSLAFSFIFKDLVACGTNLLIYLGLTIAYFSLHKDLRKEENVNKNGDGIVDIIMLVLSIVVIVILIAKYKEQCLKS